MHSKAFLKAPNLIIYTSIYQSNRKILGLNNQQSCSKTVLSEWEVFLSFLDLGDLLGLLVHAQSGSEGSGKLGSQELSSSG